MTIGKLYQYSRRKMLTAEEERAIFADLRKYQSENNLTKVRRIQSDLILQYKPVVLGAVNKMSGYSLNKDELQSEGYLALSLAINSFDISHGARFSSYAYRCVLLTLYTYITKNYFMVNPCISKKHKKLFFRLRSYLREEIQRTGNAVCDNDFFIRVSEELDTTVEMVKSMLTMMHTPYDSMSRQIGDGSESDLTLGDIIPDVKPIADDILQGKSLENLHKNIIEDALNTLDDRTRQIIKSQVLQEDKVTLSDLGEQFGISRERVRQIRESGLKKLEKYIQSSVKSANYELVDVLPN